MKRFSETCWCLRGIVSVGVKALRAAKKTLVEELKSFNRVNVIRRSKFFDAEWYLRENPDVKAACVDPAYHYLVYCIELQQVVLYKLALLDL